MKHTYLHFNEKYNEDKTFYVVLDGSDIIKEYTRFWSAQQRKRCRIFIDGDIIITKWLSPKKRTWKLGNYEEYKYKVINVGYKDKTAKLSAGLIYQLEKID